MSDNELKNWIVGYVADNSDSLRSVTLTELFANFLYEEASETVSVSKFFGILEELVGAGTINEYWNAGHNLFSIEEQDE